MKTVLLSGICALALTAGAMAHPGHGGGGPPSTVTMGPPSAAFNHVPNGVANGAANDAHLLGNLNAAHASASALQHASPNSIVGKLAIYKTQLMTALANEQAAQNAVNADNAIINNPLSTPAQVAAAKAQLVIDQAALTAAQKAVANVEASLSTFANKPVTPDVIARVNTLLGIQ